MPKKKRSIWRRTGVVVGTVAALTLAAAGGAVAVAGRSGEQYRTVEVATGDVSQSVAATGTVSSVTRVDAAFSTAGTVASVAVALGDAVTAGQELATLDADELAEAVTEAQEALTAAQETLESDLEAQTNGETVDSISSGSSSSSGGAATGGVAGMGRVFVATEESGATSAPAAGDASGSGDTGDTATSGQTACTTFLTATAEDIATADGLTAIQSAMLTCSSTSSAALQSALTALSDAQTQLETLSTALDDAVSALNTAIDAAQTAQEAENADSGSDDDGSTTPPSGGDESGSGGDQSGEMPSGGDQTGSGSAPSEDTTGGGMPSGEMPSGEATGGESGTLDSASGALGEALTTGSGTEQSGSTMSGESTGVEVTAQPILADQAAVDQAQADLDIATAAQAAGTLTSPIDGTVAQVAMAVGDTVEASSTTAVITILGADGYVVTTTLDLADVQVLAVGQSASGTVGGFDGTVTGTVSSIGVTNVSSTTTPQFTVLVAVDDPTSGLLEGASASLSIAVAQQQDVVVVPTSAVHRDGSAVTVDVLTDGTAETRDVTIGAVGAEYTEVTDGLEVGEQVILADLTIDATAEDEEEESSFGTTGFGSGFSGEMPEMSGDMPDFSGGMPSGGGFSG